jgi:LuxR family quorum sensing-dependent transcriptional regulator
MPSKLSAEILHFTESAAKFETPTALLDALDKISSRHCAIRVLGGMLLSIDLGSAESYELGKTIFLHRSVPKGWWDAHVLMQAKTPSPGVILARLALAPFTFTEATQMLEPIGMDRWAAEINLKYGIRDSMGCPIGGRWVFGFWSRKVIKIPQDQRALLYLGGAFATMRLQVLTEPFIKRLPKGASLTARELSVLRLLAMGERPAEVAEHLGLGEETVRTHIKKAQAKLGSQSPIQSVAQAIRMRLIP